jgi:hypothetical protein
MKVNSCPSSQVSTLPSDFAAIQAVRAMVKAADYDRKMLLMATKLAHEADLKALLLSVLEELLRSVQCNDDLHSEKDAATLVRCTIRLVIRLMADPTTTNRHVSSICPWKFLTRAIRNALSDTLIVHFQTGGFLVPRARNAVLAHTLPNDSGRPSADCMLSEACALDYQGHILALADGV